MLKEKKNNLPFVILIEKTNGNYVFTQFGDQYKPLRCISRIVFREASILPPSSLFQALK